MMAEKRKEGVRTTGIPSKAELEASPGYPSREALATGPIVVIECVQDIPCDPCEPACPRGAIRVGNRITNLPIFYAKKCNGCGRCIPICPGQAIFRVDMTYSEEKATVSFPYEFLPMPKKGDTVQGVNRAGEVVCEAEVLRVQNPRGFAQTAVITVAVPKDLAMEVRSVKRLKRVDDPVHASTQAMGSRKQGETGRVDNQPSKGRLESDPMRVGIDS